ncbi:MAG: hypothetical protein M1834_000007 [Cirrosporium novae-zelandiae]|nr:MAG: hypothetical protein M1834_000007 [Cirrosporium novae-zelandiae]
MSSPTGAQLIARGLRDLGVTVIFGLVGIPVIEIAEEAINLGIRFIAFRNEQAASYAASAYGYLTGRPGVCLVVGGPGVLHAIAGIGNSSANAFPLLVLAGSAETHLVTRGAFQEFDAISFLSPHTKLAARPSSLESIFDSLSNAYRTSFYGRPGPSFVDLPADLIQGILPTSSPIPPNTTSRVIPLPPGPTAAEQQIFKITQLLKSAKAPLIVIGKGAAYARAEASITTLVENTKIPFLPTPMGKGVLPDSHPLNAASARSTALRQADVILVLGARLNWILHFGDAPKWNPDANFIQVDISAEEIGRNSASASLGVVADLNAFVPQLIHEFSSWHFDSSVSEYIKHISDSKQKNEASALRKAQTSTSPMSITRALNIIKAELSSCSAAAQSDIVYVSEGANTMDMSRSIFPVSLPRHRLDAGTYATMGVGLGYAIAAWMAYNGPAAEAYATASPPIVSGAQQKTAKKKIVCLEGDSAFGFSLAEVETMARQEMDIIIFVMNNGGVYHGSADDLDSFKKLQANTLHEPPGMQNEQNNGLRSTTLSFGVRYDKIAEMCQDLGAKGWDVYTEAEIKTAVEEAWKWEGGGPCVINVRVESGKGGKLSFGWQASSKSKSRNSGAKL